MIGTYKNQGNIIDFAMSIEVIGRLRSITIGKPVIIGINVQPTDDE
jgi:hypothetical protein